VIEFLASLPVYILAAILAVLCGLAALAYAFTEGVWRLLFGASIATVRVLVDIDRAAVVAPLARAGQRAQIARQRRALTRASAPREAIPMGSGDRRC
jgi:hypothetical protein